MECKYYVYRHEYGQPEYMDENITKHTCLSQEDALFIAEDLNNISERADLKFKYYVVMV